MQKYQDTVLSFPGGRPLVGGTVSVTTTAGVTATIYSDNGVTPITSLLTDSNGAFAFYAADGRYNITISGTGFTTKTVADIILEDPADQPSLASLAASGGAALVGYLQAGAGAAAQTIQTKLRESISVKDFGAVGDGTTDDTTAINAAITAAAGKKLKFPNATYKFTSPLTITGIDVDFDGSSLFYAGAVGSFALTLNSDGGAGTAQTNGNAFDNFTLYQSNFGAYVTLTGSAVYDPPSIASGAAISNITPNGTSTTVTVTGATVGGYARATFDQIVDGMAVTARVTAPDTVTVTFSNYTSAAIDLASGTISVTVVNNAFHGLCLGGVLGKLRNAKVRGFTGVSFAMGGGVIDVTSGVTLSGNALCYYWDADLNVASAAGWCAIIPPRSNVNNLSLGTFALDAYGDSIPKRANCINQLVVGGIGNSFPRLSMEANASEETLMLVGPANLNKTLGIAYIEYNTSFAVPPFPRIRANSATAGNRLSFRHPYAGRAVADSGAGNDLQMVPSSSVNGQQLLPPSGSRNLVTNGDFENGTSGWSDFSSGSVLTVTGTGVFSGKRARYDITAGRPNLSQDIIAIGGFPVAGLIGQNITIGAWIKTNIANVKPRINGNTGNGGTVGDSTDEFISVTYKVPVGATTLPLAMTTDASGLTGFIEMSNITGVIGLNPIAFGERTQPVGSAVFNPPSIAIGAETTTTVTVTGAALGDYAIASFSLDTAGVKLTARVSAADTVTVTFRNDTAGAVDLASGTLRARVIKV